MEWRQGCQKRSAVKTVQNERNVKKRVVRGGGKEENDERVCVWRGVRGRLQK